jgi:hypothetical protein
MMSGFIVAETHRLIAAFVHFVVVLTIMPGVLIAECAGAERRPRHPQGNREE